MELACFGSHLTCATARVSCLPRREQNSFLHGSPPRTTHSPTPRAAASAAPLVSGAPHRLIHCRRCFPREPISAPCPRWFLAGPTSMVGLTPAGVRWFCFVTATCVVWARRGKRRSTGVAPVRGRHAQIDPWREISASPSRGPIFRRLSRRKTRTRLRACKALKKRMTTDLIALPPDIQFVAHKRDCRRFTT